MFIPNKPLDLVLDLMYQLEEIIATPFCGWMGGWIHRFHINGAVSLISFYCCHKLFPLLPFHMSLPCSGSPGPPQVMAWQVPQPLTQVWPSVSIFCPTQSLFIAWFVNTRSQHAFFCNYFSPAHVLPKGIPLRSIVITSS